MARSEVITGEVIDNNIDEKKERFMSTVNRSPKSLNNKDGQKYMSDPDTIKFMSEMTDRCFGKKRGRPYAFDSLETLNNDINEYIMLCYTTNTVPTVASAALWLGVNRDTLYTHANNSNSIFSDTCKNVINLCHVTMENGAISNKINSVLYMYLSKNYFGLRDDRNITVTPSDNSSNINSNETMSALQKQIEEESVPNATFTEE